MSNKDKLNDFKDKSHGIGDRIHQSSEGLSGKEKADELKRASEEYLNGDISQDALGKIEEDLAVDYSKAAFESVSVFSAVCSAFRRFRAKGKYAKSDEG